RPAWAYEKTFGPGPVRLTLRIDQTELGLAERVRLEEELVIEPGFSAEFPQYLLEDFEGFAVVDLDSGPAPIRERTSVSDARDATLPAASNAPASLDAMPATATDRAPSSQPPTQLRKTLVLEPLRSGDLRIAPLEVYFHRDGEESESSFETEPIRLSVRPIDGVEKLEVSRPRDIFRQTPERERSWMHVWVAAAAGGGLLLIAGTLLYLRRRPRAAPPPPAPHEVAWENLRRLIAMDLVEKGELERFFVFLSGILRQYIEDRFRVRAPELTTEEFFEAAQRAPELAPSRERLSRFLILSDQVKFARYAPPPETVQESFDVVKKFIEETTPHEP
ncbi:MAG TPA: hypothetical protein VK116_20300, partial [Planctomycetota bacterium]|nr:hypothetical protein [Planctomycetota bacterium]